MELAEFCCDLILGDLASVLPPTTYIHNGIAALRDQIKERRLKVIVLQERFVESELLYTFLFPFMIVIKAKTRKDRRAQLCSNSSHGKTEVGRATVLSWVPQDACKVDYLWQSSCYLSCSTLQCCCYKFQLWYPFEQSLMVPSFLEMKRVVHDGTEKLTQIPLMDYIFILVTLPMQ